MPQDIQIQITATNQQAATSILQIVGAVNRLEAALKSAGSAGRRAGGGAVASWGNLPNTIGSTIAQLAGIATPIMALHGALRIVRGEYEALIRLGKEAQQGEFKRAVGIQEASAAFNIRTQDEMDEFEQVILETSRSSGLLAPTVSRAMLGIAGTGVAKNEEGEQDFTRAADLVGLSAQFQPAAVSNQDSTAITNFGREVAGLSKLLDISDEAAASKLRTVFQNAFPGDPQKVFQFVVPRARQMVTGSSLQVEMGREEKSKEFDTSVALIAALTQVAADFSGRPSGRNAVIAAADMAQVLLRERGEQKSVFEAIKSLEDDPDLRMKFAGPLALGPDASSDDIRKALAVRPELQGAAVMRASLAAMTIPGSQENELLHQILSELQKQTAVSDALRSVQLAKESPTVSSATAEVKSGLVRQERNIALGARGRMEKAFSDLADVQVTAGMIALERSIIAGMERSRPFISIDDTRRALLDRALNARDRFIRRELDSDGRVLDPHAPLPADAIPSLSPEDQETLGSIDRSIKIMVDALRSEGIRINGELPARIVGDDRPASSIPERSPQEALNQDQP